jgi:SAM-dependent methyltransferase
MIVTTGKGDNAAFDAWADDDAYARALDASLSVSGESGPYFAEQRVRWVNRFLSSSRAGGRGNSARRALDYGCGIGGTAPLLRDLAGAEDVLGVDVSPRAIARARADQEGAPRVAFDTLERFSPAGDRDIVYANGVFHHIAPSARAAAMATVASALAPGGLAFVWENNPYNPATRFIMSRCPFDDDAVLVWPRQLRRLCRGAGLRPVTTAFCFIFPAALAPLRPIERRVERLPLGAQYVVVAEKP